MTKKSYIKFLGLLLVVGLLFAAAPVGQAQAATLNVCPSGCTYSTIQAAINAAIPGDTINVAAGTYTEQLLIQKNLILVGAGIGQTIVQAPTTGRVTAPGYTGQTWTIDNWNTDYLLAAYPTDPVSGTPISVKVSGFTFDASGQSHIGDRFTGVYFRKVFNSDIGAAGLFDSEIKGFSTSDPSVTGIRVLESSKLTLSGNLVKDYTILGIVVYGTDNLVDPIVTTTGNTLTPAGNVEGIQYRFINGTGVSGEISNNHITNGGNHGIAAVSSDHILIKNNTIDGGSGNGITIESSSNCTVQNNTITNCPWNGIAVTDPYGNSDGNLIQGNTISGIHSGDISSLGSCGWGIGMDGSSVINTVVTGNDVSASDAGVVFYGVDATNAAHNNIIHDNSPYNMGNSNASETINAENNWWGSAAGPVASTISGLVDYDPWLTHQPVHNVTQDTYFSTIQAAIAAAVAGDTINVAPGEYVEVGQIVIDKNLTIVGANKATTIIKPAQDTGNGGDARGWFLVNAGVQFNLSNVTLDGAGKLVSIGILSHGTGTIENNIIKNIGYNPSGPDYAGRGIAIYDADMTIKDNLLQNIGRIGIYVYGTVADQVVIDGNTYEGKGIGDWLDYGIEIEGGADAEVKNNLIKNCTGVASVDGSGSAGLLITTYFAPGSTANIHDNEFNGNSVGINVGYDSTDTSSVVAEKNQLLNNVTAIVTTDPAVDGSPNWWGNAAGPGASQISGTVDFTPWCTDATCLHTAPDASGNVNLSGNISIPGGILINEPGITYHLAANTVIENNSPCFVIEASNTIIEAEPGAKCVPTDSANGIDVAAGLNNITIEGIEFDGSGQETGDGIHFAGAVTDIVLVDNYLHGLDGDGIEFAGDVGEIVNIQGNMFKNNTGYGINNLGANTVGAEYNSWGNVAGPAAGDGVNGLVTSTPFTHADLYLASSGTPWANQVVKGQNITYTVKAHLANVNAADFVLTYPAELTYVSSTASGSLGTEELIADTTLRTLKFRGYNTVNVTGDLPLFTVTFTGSTAGANKPLSFSYRTTSGFAMVGFESSTNVFVNEMVNGEVTIIDLPTISSTDIQGYYLSGEQRQFSVILDNPLTGADYAHVYVDFTIANAQVEQIDAIEYSVDNGATWVALGTGPGTSIANSGSDVVGYFGKITGGGFPLASDDNLTTLFRVTFKTREQGATDYPNSYSISMSLKDADTADPDTELAAFTKTAYVYDKPTLNSTDIQGYYLVGEERAFHVQVVNPATGGSFTSIYYNFEIANAAPTDIASLVCGGQTISLSQSGTKLVGSTGPFPMPANQSWDTPCSVKFNTAKNYAFTVYMTDSIPDPDRTLVTYTQTANVYTPPTLTSSDIVGPYLAGVAKDFHVTVNNPATGGSFVDSIYYVFTIADAELEDIYSLVCDGNSVTFTQSGSSLVGRTGYAGHGFPMPAGQEWITTCNVLFKNAGSYTFTVDMVDNPSGVIANDRILVSMSQTATVNSGFAITGTFSMQGNASRAGIPVTLTWAGTGWTYGPSANTTSAISNNFSLSVLYGGEYTITTLQPRYLNVTADLLKKITVAGPYNMSALILKGGNAYWRFSETVLDNEINSSDSSIVGTQYGTAGADAGFGNHGDCNFDGTVNIQDLALVGGNWSLTSAAAYVTGSFNWVP